MISFFNSDFDYTCLEESRSTCDVKAVIPSVISIVEATSLIGQSDDACLNSASSCMPDINMFLVDASLGMDSEKYHSICS